MQCHRTKMEFFKNKIIKTKDLIPYVLNSRTHTEEQVGQIASSIREFGFTNPVLVDEENNVIAGHGRLLAAQTLGLEKVPAVIVTGLDERKRRALVIADNKLALNAGWDAEALRVELEDLAGDFGELMGFSQDELVELLQKGDNEGLTDDDYVPDEPINETTRTGDVWVMKDHRLICGDSTSFENLDLLMGGKVANMCFTDPPYLMDFTGGLHADGSKSFNATHGKITNDKMSKADGEAFLDSINTAIKNYVDGAFYITFYRLGINSYYASLERVGLKCRSLVIWDKGNHTLSSSDYMSMYEPIFYGWVNKHKFYGGKNGMDIWRIQRTAKNELHPTMKPVALCEKAINDGSQVNGIVLDIFCGSGSTLIAAEKTNRVCYAAELEPKYCDVTVERWQEWTGLEARLESNGKTYNELKNAVEAKKCA